jgi:hypothetical protein
MKKKHEIGVFRRFAQVSGLPILPESIEQPPEPEPDILCEIIGEGRVAFELTRIDDEAFHRKCVQMQERQRQFKAKMVKDPATTERYRGAHIFPDKGMTVEKIWTTLRSAPHVGERFYLQSKYIDIERTRASHDPFLGHDMVHVEVEAFERIQEKVKKVQQGVIQTPHPIEIIAYFDIQRILEGSWQDRLCRLQTDLPAVLSIPQVKRVWVYHNLDDKVMYVYPPPKVRQP